MRSGLSPTAKNSALSTDTAVMTPTTNNVSCHHLYRRRMECQRADIPFADPSRFNLAVLPMCKESVRIQIPLHANARSDAHTSGHPLCTGSHVLPAKLTRYAAVASLMMKHRPDLIAADVQTANPPATDTPAEPERLAKDLEKLG